MRYYISSKDIRKLADNFKNSIYNFNKLITRENIPLGLFTETLKKFKSRFLNMESREILIFSNSDKKFFSQNRL
jgi:hypothetical protein